ncbi:MAG: hypothetical protein LBD58_06735 [Treponema sp.]|jgi:hypothetical protein|nr:hypothetical protein [Treponema sp.]
MKLSQTHLALVLKMEPVSKRELRGLGLKLAKSKDDVSKREVLKHHQGFCEKRMKKRSEGGFPNGERRLSATEVLRKHRAYK